MRIVDPFLAAWPDVDLDVTTAFQFGGLAALPGHEIDLLVTPDPVARERLDIYTKFPVPTHALPRRHRTVETTDLMLRLVASGRAVSATPDWLLRGAKGVTGVRIGSGIPKSVHLDYRAGTMPGYLEGIMQLADSVEI